VYAVKNTQFFLENLQVGVFKKDAMSFVTCKLRIWILFT